MRRLPASKLRVAGKQPDGVLPCLASLSALQVLVVEFSAATLRRDDILSLQALTLLRELRIKGEADSDDECFEALAFDDADLLELLQGLPRLRHFEFTPEVLWSDDGPLLRLVGEVAPALEELSLYGRLNVQALSPSAASPALPRLQNLSITGIQLVMPPGVHYYEVVSVHYLE